MSDAAFPTRVVITEVGPRDGLQNEAQPVPTEAKAAFVRELIAAGAREIEVSAFVRPDRVPQLADAAALFEALGPAPQGVTFAALVPNAKGLERALAVGVGKVAVFTAASETFNQRNVNASIAASLGRFAPVVEGARAEGLPVRGYVSTAIRCPFEGPIDPHAVRGVCEDLLDLGCDEVSVGDTIGAGTPAEVGRLLDALLAHIASDHLVMHFHDTRGMAIANTVESLRHGIARFDASAAGLGGCPFAPGATGNLATEDLVFLLDGLGIDHGFDLARLKQAGEALVPHLGHGFASRVRAAPGLDVAAPDGPEA